MNADCLRDVAGHPDRAPRRQTGEQRDELLLGRVEGRLGLLDAAAQHDRAAARGHRGDRAVAVVEGDDRAAPPSGATAVSSARTACSEKSPPAATAWASVGAWRRARRHAPERHAAALDVRLELAPAAAGEAVAASSPGVPLSLNATFASEAPGSIAASMSSSSMRQVPASLTVSW